MAKKNGSSNTLLRGNKVIWAGMGVMAVLIFVGMLSFLQSFFQTETYYVLNDEQGETIPARSLITEDMLSPLVIAEGTAPPNAIGLDEVMGGYVYTKYALSAGDILTESNAGSVDDIYLGVPDNWVITNFSVGADDAVGGRIHPGSYFDVMVADENGSFYPFINVLALDTTVDLSSASSAAAADSAEAYEGQTTQYVVAMSPENAAKLHNVVAKYTGSMKLVLSPKQNDYNKPQLSDYSELFVFDDPSTSIWPGESAEGEVTDSDFGRVERDEEGKPLQESLSRSGGNLRQSAMGDIVSGSGTSTQNEASAPTPSQSPSDSSTTTEDAESEEYSDLG